MASMWVEKVSIVLCENILGCQGVRREDVLVRDHGEFGELDDVVLDEYLVERGFE